VDTERRGEVPYEYTYEKYCVGCRKVTTGWYRNPKTGRLTGSYCRACYLESRRTNTPLVNSTRDTQKQRVYESEWAVKGVAYKPIRIPDLETAQDFVDFITETRWYPEQFPDGYKRVKVVSSSRSSRWAWGGHGKITLPSMQRGAWAWTDVVLIHELTHNAINSGPPHGPEFTSGMLRLTERYIPEMYEPLLEQYEKRRVRVAGMTFDRRTA